jgi:hypothetical protein
MALSDSSKYDQQRKSKNVVIMERLKNERLIPEIASCNLL